MRSKIHKIIAITAAAAMIVCIGAGCAKNEGKTEESKAPSAASEAASSKEESKTESSAESKTESKTESKESSAEESKAESAESSAESSTESSAESSAESSDESSEQESSEEESSEVSVLTMSDVAGSWEYNVGSDYMLMELYADGTGALRLSAGGEAISATWEVSGDQVVVYALGGSSSYSYINDTLSSEDEVFYRPTGDIPDVSQVVSFDPVGEWVYNVGEDYLSISIYQGGSAVYRYGDGTTVSGSWDVDGETVSIYANGGRQDLTYSGGVLTDDFDGKTYYQAE